MCGGIHVYSHFKNEYIVISKHRTLKILVLSFSQHLFLADKFIFHVIGKNTILQFVLFKVTSKGTLIQI